MNQVLRWILAAVVMGSAAASARAQCVRGWDTVVGSPGVTSDGYAGPMGLYNDGRGPALYIGGSFNAMGGYVARSIARSHGGDVTLANREGGGLRATLHLPRVREGSAPVPNPQASA